MGLLDHLIETGKELITHVGGEAGAERLLSLFDGHAAASEDAAPGALDDLVRTVLEEARGLLGESPASERDELGHGLLAYLRRFSHPEADAAAAKTHDLSSPDDLLGLIRSALKVNPGFLAEVARYFLKGPQGDVVNESGPSSWMLSLLRSPEVAAFFNRLLIHAGSRLFAARAGATAAVEPGGEAREAPSSGLSDVLGSLLGGRNG